MATSEGDAVEKRSYKKSGKHVGEAPCHRRHRDIVSSATKSEVVQAAVAILTSTEKANLSRVDKQKRLETLLSDLDGADAVCDPECVEKIAGSWLKSIEAGELAAWEVYGAAMYGLVEGRKMLRWAKKPVAQKNEENQKPMSRRRKPPNSAKNAVILMREFKDESPVDVIKAVWKLNTDQTIKTGTYFSITEYFKNALLRLDPNNCLVSLGAVDIYRRLKQHLDNDEVPAWEVLRLACNKCHPKKPAAYPKWARKPKDISTIAEGPMEQAIEQTAQNLEAGEATDGSSDEFADAFGDDATVIQMNAADLAHHMSILDHDGHPCDSHVEGDEERVTAAPAATTDNEDKMSIEQLKRKLNAYRTLSRQNPQIFLQELTRLNNKIQDRIQRIAQEAKEELRNLVPSQERPVRKRERIDILGHMKRVTPTKAAVPEKKTKRARNAMDPQAQTVQEAILKHLEESVATNTENKEDTKNDLFEELFGPGPSEEPENDLEAQLELDLSEL